MPLRFPNIDEAKSELERKVNDYYCYFEKNPESKLVNVTFGELNKDEWVVFHDNHFNSSFNSVWIDRMKIPAKRLPE